MQNGQCKIIRPEWNIPFEIVYRTAEPVQGTYGDQIKYVLANGQITYLDAAVAQKAEQLGAAPGVPFTVLKKKDGRQTAWQIWRNDSQAASPSPKYVPSTPSLWPKSAAGPAAAPSAQPPANYTNGLTTHPQNTRNGHGELAVPLISANGNAPGQPNGNHVRSPAPSAQQANFQYLIEQAQGLIDAYGSLLKYASERHGSAVKPEDVRALLTTMFIQQAGRR